MLFSEKNTNKNIDNRILIVYNIVIRNYYER
uniref:Uncharacterized protein n=1 Tax=Inoviridae sp. ctDEu7 TaxID=2826759 RepID=A0A8S5MUJ6_9VIRU|nr:MAG TPA: hypothetical protein [Inoviridae sp. ctDEu7]